MAGGAEAAAQPIEREYAPRGTFAECDYYEELGLREIGEVLGVTESRVSQLHTKAVLRLKAHLSGATASLSRCREGPLSRALSVDATSRLPSQ
jgi:Sigma-70, region 4